ncbi:hypothetical protein PZ895_11260 [Mesorhizobium sp. YIM 152430]|uniref:hypothetical protein n=1 Tax=Mesorhizobium sp. YIM 152430 TaxID=3031761 RepID=UPI0023D9E35C|nr:hypothetical protein [Mesorhizobium sp. YIM 152430]MDF1600338.1 hypothetical protein [Mesorhizobium sp. YIM 152430]
MVKMHSISLTLDVIEQATIKAALIHWCNLETRPEDLEYLAGNCGEFSLLDRPQLDRLIEKVSTGD